MKQTLSFFQHQSSLYFDLTRVTATIATSRDAKAIKEAKTRFDQLYWGELVTVEDRRVELAVKAFHERMERGANNCERGRVDIDNEQVRNDKRDIPIQATLRELSLDIGSCARSALQAGQKIKFGKSKALAAKCPYSRKQEDEQDEFDPED